MKLIGEIYNDIEIMKKRADEYCLLRDEFNDYIQSVKGTDKYNNDSPQPQIIWMLWLQGVENAPQIVKACYRSVLKLKKDYKIILLTGENISQYVHLPPLVYQKWANGIISNTAMSNLIRLEVLCEYGGIWIDGTVLCATNHIPEYITSAPLFMYSSWKWITGDVRPVSTWFIAAKPHHPILDTVRKALLHYWEKKNGLDTYFIFHMFFRMVIDEYPNLWRMVSRYSNVPPHLLQFELGDVYNNKRLRELISMSPFHKLTYKLPKTVLESKNNYYYNLLSLY